MKEERRDYSGADFLIERRGDLIILLAIKKGDSFKLFRGDSLKASDTQISLRAGQEDRLCKVVAHLQGNYVLREAPDEVEVEGALSVAGEETAKDWREISAVGRGGHLTSVYAVMSRIFEASHLQLWDNLTSEIKALARGRPLVLTRRC